MKARVAMAGVVVAGAITALGGTSVAGPNVGRFAASRTAAPLGATVTVHSTDPCVPPSGAPHPAAVVDFIAIDEGNDAISIQTSTIPVNRDGSWSGTITIGGRSPGHTSVGAICLSDASDWSTRYAEYDDLPFTVMTVGRGYWLASSNEAVTDYGDAVGQRVGKSLNRPIVAAAPFPITGAGLWLTAADGGVFASGDAPFLGGLADRQLNAPIVALAASPTGNGYWLAAADGGVFTFGDATFLGSLGGRRLNRPIVSMAATSTGKGYWLAAADGGVFAFGDATFLGSASSFRLNSPIVGIGALPSGDGYWLAAGDGGVFSFGSAPFFGSAAGRTLNGPVVGMAPTASGRGYWLGAADGGVFAYGDAPFLGAGARLPVCFCGFVDNLPKPGPVVVVAATPKLP